MVGIGMPGMSEWIVILVIVLIFFGAGKLPEVFSQAGKGIKAFKDASEGKDAKKGEDEDTDERPAKKKSPKQIAAQDELDDEASEVAEKSSSKPRKE